MAPGSAPSAEHTRKHAQAAAPGSAPPAELVERGKELRMCSKRWWLWEGGGRWAFWLARASSSNNTMGEAGWWVGPSCGGVGSVVRVGKVGRGMFMERWGEKTVQRGAMCHKSELGCITTQAAVQIPHHRHDPQCPHPQKDPRQSHPNFPPLRHQKAPLRTHGHPIPPGHALY